MQSLYVGFDTSTNNPSHGALTITNGGQVSFWNTDIGSTGGVGVATVNGIGSKLTNTGGALLVGEGYEFNPISSNGTLVVTNGGQVVSLNQMAIGINDGTGTVIVGKADGTDSGSTLFTAPTLTLGQNFDGYVASSATLNINHGGTVSISGATTLYQTSNAAVINLQGGTFQTGTLDRKTAALLTGPAAR